MIFFERVIKIYLEEEAIDLPNHLPIYPFTHLPIYHPSIHPKTHPFIQHVYNTKYIL